MYNFSYAGRLGIIQVSSRGIIILQAAALNNPNEACKYGKNTDC